MKKQFLATFLLAMTVFALTAATNAAASFKWAQTTYDFGRIPQNQPVTVKFEFTNSGNEPLIIKKAQGTCGCTGVEHPKDPILPGKSGEIKATFNAAALGQFTKTVTVESNATEGFTILTFKGEVIK